jgi:hypothetical protein
MAVGDRVESMRRIAELTGLGIAATYFLDPEQGADRRRAARRWIAAAIGDGRDPPGGSTAGTGTAEPPTVDEPSVGRPSPSEPPRRDEVVILTTARPQVAPAPPREIWPRWGWPLVVAVTLCAIGAFAAIGVGIWAIDTHHSTTTLTTATIPRRLTLGAQILADPAARRVTGTASTGTVLLRTDAAGAALAVGGLPELSRKQVYRVWIEASGATTAAGAFRDTATLVTIAQPLTDGDQITITREPVGGDARAPHGQKVASVLVKASP